MCNLPRAKLSFQEVSDGEKISCRHKVGNNEAESSIDYVLWPNIIIFTPQYQDMVPICPYQNLIARSEERVTLGLIVIPFSSAVRRLCLSSVSEKLYLSPLLSALFPAQLYSVWSWWWDRHNCHAGCYQITGPERTRTP